MIEDLFEKLAHASENLDFLNQKFDKELEKLS
jgi:hypothetical protein